MVNAKNWPVFDHGQIEATRFVASRSKTFHTVHSALANPGPTGPQDAGYLAELPPTLAEFQARPWVVRQRSHRNGAMDLSESGFTTSVRPRISE